MISRKRFMMKEKKKKELAVAADREERAADKMTIYEYEQKYVKRQNLRGAKLLLHIVAAAIGILLFACLFSVTVKVWELNEYAGYGMIAVSVLLYIFLFLVPLVKISKSDYFEVNVNAKTARAAQRHNRKVRHEIAEKIIDLTAKVEGAGWYDDLAVGKLAIALRAGDEKELMKRLTELYTGSVKKSAKDLIFRSAMKSAMYSAISQTSRADALLVAFLNLQLVKDLVFLYGFRPSDAKLIKIFARVLQNSLVAYGLGNAKLGNTIVKTMGDAVKGIPILGSAISALVDSSIQGLTNGVLTAVIGYQTIKYMNDEYRLQEILDGVEVCETEEELQQACEEIERELKAGDRKMPKAV